jgi:capsular polysaccharide biosynthesis protein
LDIKLHSQSSVLLIVVLQFLASVAAYVLSLTTLTPKYVKRMCLYVGVYERATAPPPPLKGKQEYIGEVREYGAEERNDG